MKAFYLILCVCFAVFITTESNNAVKKYTEKLTHAVANLDACRNVNGATIEYITNINKTVEELEAPEMEESRNKIGCYLSCLMQEKGAMNGTVLNIQKIKDTLLMAVDSNEKITQEVIDTVVNISQDCVKQVENVTNVCLIGWKFGKCMGAVLGV